MASPQPHSASSSDVPSAGWSISPLRQEDPHNPYQVSGEFTTQLAGEVRITVQDKLGRPCYRQCMQVPAGSTLLAMHLPPLPDGQYQIWLSHHGHTRTQSLVLVPVKRKRSWRSLLNWLG